MNETSAALRLFGSIFQREVDVKLLDQIQAQRQELIAVLEHDPLEKIKLDNADSTVEILAVEYCRLFIGPNGHLPPVESVVRGEGRYWGTHTVAVSDFYQSHGIGLKPGENTFPDHISMELDCLAMLEESDRHDQAMIFAQEHILKWIPALIKHIGENASLAFYPAWAEGLHKLLLDLYVKEA